MTQDSNQALYFHCNMCGECCSSWNIPIEGEKASRLLSRPWVQDRLAETHRTLVQVSDDFYRIPLTDQNVCVFLADDRRCLVETHEGLALKPKECQRFPFATIKMPDGSNRHETSAACKLVSEKLLLAFQPILPKPAETGVEQDSIAALQQHEDAQFDEVGYLPGRIPIHFFDKLPVARYETVYLAQVQAIFEDSHRHPDELLYQLAHQCLKHCKKDATHQPAKTGRLTNFRISDAAAAWMTILFLRKPYRTLSWMSLLGGRQYHDPRIFGLPIHLKQQRSIPWNPAHNRLLNAFLYQILHRKRLLASGSSLCALLAMTTVASLLVQWYARTLAWFQEAPEIYEKDVATAIRLVERYYTGHQPRFLQFFTSRCKGWLVAKVLLR
jgi:Fe-S-cluster containining protein